MSSTYAPGTEYLINLNNGGQLATGGFDSVQSLFNVVKAIWGGEQEGSITTWDATKRQTWSSIQTYESLLNPYTIVAILDIRESILVPKIG